MVPTGRPSAVARCACAASSTSARLCFAAIASSGRMSAACPYKCTGNNARVRGVIAASTSRGSRVSRSGSMSVKTGRAPAIITASAEYAAESGGVITSSPGPISSARRIKVIASVPVPTPTAYGTPLAAANSVSKASTSGPEDEPSARDHTVDGGAHGGRVLTGRERVKRNPNRHNAEGSCGSTRRCA